LAIGGFYGRLLRVDLSERSVRVEPIPDPILLEYLGGKGLGSYLLLKNLEPGVEPFSAKNKVIFSVGPATGTPMLGSSRYGVYTKSPLTGGYAESCAGGRVGDAIKATGYDAVIIEGRCDKPTYVEISDEYVRFHDACHLWGLDTYGTEEAVLKSLRAKNAQAVVIGPAGERLVRFASLVNNRWRSASRCGIGAVLGSKLVKAVVFHGSRKANVPNEAELKLYVTRLINESKGSPAVESFRRYGTPMMVALVNEAGAFPTKYWSRGRMEGWELLSAEHMVKNYQVRARACPRCILACAKLTRVAQGPRKGLELEGPEYETIYAFGGLCCIKNLDDVLYLNDICDRLGMDTISAGNILGLVMEAAERGLPKAGGLPRYGDTDGAAHLLKNIANREGIGDILAEGIVPVSRYFGLEDIAIHVKGLEPAGYDPRPLKGMALAYATSTRGACHLRATFYKAELGGLIPPEAIEGKAKLYVDFEDRLTILNTLIVCVFYRDLLQWSHLTELMSILTGINWSEEALRRVAGRIITLTRTFNLQQGIGEVDDRLPQRLFKEPLLDTGTGITREEFQYMLKEYYALRKWDDKSRLSNGNSEATPNLM